MSQVMNIARSASQSDAMLGSFPLGDAPELQVGDYYVGPDGNDGNAGTSRATAFATLEHVIPLMTANQTVVVLDGYNGSIWTDLLAQNPGTSGNHKKIVGEFPNTRFYGPIGNWGDYEDFNTIRSAYWGIEDLLFMQTPYIGVQRYPNGAGASTGGGHTNTKNDEGCVSYLKGTEHLAFFRCGWFGGNGKNLLIGDNQCFDYCYGFGGGARYIFQAFDSELSICRRCVVRSDEGWIQSGGNPWGALQNYSSRNMVYLQCIVIDCLASDPSAAPVGSGVMSQTYKDTAPQGLVADVNNTSMDAEGCFAVDSPIAGFGFERANGATAYAVNKDCVARRCANGFYGDNSDLNSEVHIDGGDSRGNTSRGFQNNRASLVDVSNSNASGNGVEDYGSTVTQTNNTSSAANFDWKGLDVIGVQGTFHGEAGYRTVQTGTKLFGVDGSGFAHEDVIRAAFLMYVNPYSTSNGPYSAKTATAGTDADRGFCSDGQTLTNYMWRDD